MILELLICILLISKGVKIFRYLKRCKINQSNIKMIKNKISCSAFGFILFLQSSIIFLPPIRFLYAIIRASSLTTKPELI